MDMNKWRRIHAVEVTRPDGAPEILTWRVDYRDALSFRDKVIASRMAGSIRVATYSVPSAVKGYWPVIDVLSRLCGCKKAPHHRITR